MIVRFTMILLAMCCSLTLMAQQLHGFVLDMEGNPLPGASITIKENPACGTITDNNGYYQLSLPDGKNYAISVSYIGYEGVIVSVADSNNGELTFHLKESSSMLSTVVVTATRTPKLLKDAPLVTRVITEMDLKKADATNVGELLQTELPGIEFSYSMNQQTSLNMSGFGGNAVLFLVDGERLAGETLDNIDYTRLNMDNVGRIEIVKGAASSLYGSNAIGGVVNIVSREAEQPWTINVNAKYATHNEQRYGASIGLKKGHVCSMTNIQYTSIDNIDLTKGTDKENVGDYDVIYGNATLNIKERLVYTINNKMKLTARAGYFIRQRNASPTQKERYRSFTGGVKGNYDISPKDNLELSYAFDQYDKSDYLTLSGLDVRDYSNVQHVLHLLYNHSFANKHWLTIGGDYMRDYLMSYQFKDQGSYVQHTTDAFLQFDWNPHKKFNMVGGLRFDYFSATQLAHVSPKIGAMYKIGNCSLRGSYASGFRAPTLKEMYMNFYMGNIFMIYGNPQLKAETSHNFSLSAEYFNRQHCFTITGFYNRVGNKITTAWNKELGGQVYTNMSSLQVTGAEANVTGKYSFGLSWRLSYAYTYEHIKKGEPLLANTRPHTATIRLSYDKEWNNYGITVSLSGRILSSLTADIYTALTSYQETTTQTYPGYTIWKLNCVQRIWKGINLTLAIDNLFNYRPDYYYSNSPITTGIAGSVGLALDIEQMFKKTN